MGFGVKTASPLTATPTDRQILYHNTQTDIQKALLQIIQFADDKKDHIPPIMTAELTPFPFHILVNPPAIAPPTRSSSPRSLAVAAASRALSGAEKQTQHNSYFTAPLHSIAKRITQSNNGDDSE